MRPRPFGRGISHARWRAWSIFSRFNEAATFRPRNRRADVRLGAAHDASMRPRPFGRGIAARDGHVLDLGLASMRPRPFGRGIPPLAPLDLARAGSASMRPRPFGRGIAAPGPGDGGDSAASMRPRPFGRGIQSGRSCPRECTAASMRPRPFGRGIAVRPRFQLHHWTSFNEAATFRPRNLGAAQGNRLAGRDASMRPRPFGRGITRKAFARKTAAGLQ